MFLELVSIRFPTYTRLWVYKRIPLKFYTSNFRSSHPEVFSHKGVLENFAKLTGKHLCQSLFFNKVAGLRPATLVKRRL